MRLIYGYSIMYYPGSPVRNSLRFVVFSRLFSSIPGSLLEIPYHRGKTGEELVYSLLPDAEVLCTHTVPLVEVERYYDLWKDALGKELHSMIHEKQALKVISEAELTKIL